MDRLEQWPQLRAFCDRASLRPDVQVWLFGSALLSANPADLDVLVVYEDRSEVIALRAERFWDDYKPPIHLIAMTADEEADYRFIETVRAQRLR